MKRIGDWWFRTAACVIAVGLAGRGMAQVTDAQVEARIKELQQAIIGQQQANGSWNYGGYPVGATALAVLALKYSELPNDHPAVRRGVEFILNNRDGRVYSEGLVPPALELVDPKAHLPRIREAAEFLAKAQLDNGGWTYTTPGARATTFGGDNSNAQFAVLGLAAAERCGVPIPDRVRERGVRYWYNGQTEDGGWNYTQRAATRPSYLAMTAAGLASLHLLGEDLLKPAAACGQYTVNERMNKAMARLDELVKLGADGPRGHGQFEYTQYAIERVGIFMHFKEIGGVDWYREGVRLFLGGGRGGQVRRVANIANQAFELLFLARGHTPIALAKWEWSGEWNTNRMDIQRWSEIASEDLERPLDWITGPLDRPDASAAKASLIFLSGRNIFRASPEEWQFLRAFLEGGGVVVAEAACQDRLFMTSLQRELLTRLYPGQTLTFQRVAPEHPACSAKYPIAPEAARVWEVRGGCTRKNLVVLEEPIAPFLEGRPLPPAATERARRVAINLVAWALGSRPAQFKLDTQALEFRDLPPVDRDAYRPSREASGLRQPLGRLRWPGSEAVCPQFFPRLDALLQEVEDGPSFDGEVLVTPEGSALFETAALFVAGDRPPRLTREAMRNLQMYLQSGGAVLATGCACGDAFADGFRQIMQALLPNDRWEEIPADDPIWKAPFDIRARRPEATRAYRERHGEDWAPLHGIRRDGRWVVVLSPVDLCCGFEENPDPSTLAYRREDAFPLVANILHHFLAP